MSASVIVFTLSACGSFDAQNAILKVNETIPAFTGGRLEMVGGSQQFRIQEAKTKDLLTQSREQGLSQNDAVHIALVNNPALQGLLARHAANGAIAAQSGQIANPLLTLESIRRGDASDLSRMISFSLVDLLSLSQRQNLAQSKISEGQLQMSIEVVNRITQVRKAWVDAVAAKQSFIYANQVNDVAQSSATLAKQMRDAGNFSKLQAARQQAFYADAFMQFKAAQQREVSSRENLIRLLGLTDEQKQMLHLPERLPNLPTAPIDAEKIKDAANAERLDIRLAKIHLEYAAKRQGLTSLTSWTDVQLSVARETGSGSSGTRGDVNSLSDAGAKRTTQISFSLPLFDQGQLQRDSMNANTRAASFELESVMRNAASTLRESYSAYLTSYDIAQHYHTDVLVLHEQILRENQLRYNGMLVSVFELLDDARTQVHGVIAAIQAEQDFWLADAALQAEIIGAPHITSGQDSRNINE
ncbi:TolC family protein [Undibacterium sp. Dicai25W]|uniref:TolC family protein n=1 Tax=Undibacterium sp. Dicai25W TaxID=3413034 RepID=UPI003BF5F81B